jgi:hypothetical protein
VVCETQTMTYRLALAIELRLAGNATAFTTYLNCHDTLNKNNLVFTICMNVTNTIIHNDNLLFTRCYALFA